VALGFRARAQESVQRFLEPGEEVQAIFGAQTGPSPYFLFLAYIFVFWFKYFLVVVTDRRILLARASIWRTTQAQEVVATYPRETRLGPVSGLWGKIELGGNRYWVHKRFHSDVAAADAKAGTAAS
jgi:hypothetical protein